MKSTNKITHGFLENSSGGQIDGNDISPEKSHGKVESFVKISWTTRRAERESCSLWLTSFTPTLTVADISVEISPPLRPTLPYFHVKNYPAEGKHFLIFFSRALPSVEEKVIIIQVFVFLLSSRWLPASFLLLEVFHRISPQSGVWGCSVEGFSLRPRATFLTPNELLLWCFYIFHFFVVYRFILGISTNFILLFSIFPLVNVHGSVVYVPWRRKKTHSRAKNVWKLHKKQRSGTFLDVFFRFSLENDLSCASSSFTNSGHMKLSAGFPPPQTTKTFHTFFIFISLFNKFSLRFRLFLLVESRLLLSFYPKCFLLPSENRGFSSIINILKLLLSTYSSLSLKKCSSLCYRHSSDRTGHGRKSLWGEFWIVKLISSCIAWDLSILNEKSNQETLQEIWQFRIFLSVALRWCKRLYFREQNVRNVFSSVQI